MDLTKESVKPNDFDLLDRQGGECVIVRSERLSRKIHPRRTAALCEEGFVIIDRDYLPASSAGAIESEQGWYISDIDADDIRRFSNLEAAPYGFETDYDVLGWACAMMTESPLGVALLTRAKHDGWKIKLSDLSTGGFLLEVPQKIIVLDHFSLKPSALGRSAFFRNALLVSMIKALRDAWHETGWDGVESHYKPEAILMLERARAADGDAAAVLAAWELRGAGYSEIWRHLIGSEDGDMALTFMRSIERDPASLYNGLAMSRTFAQWFTDDLRVATCDHETLEHLDALLTQDMETEFCLGDHPLDTARLETLSKLPDGTFYLTGQGAGMVKNPDFIGVNDTLNEAHLFHLIYDLQVVMVGGVPFRDARLARKIFPPK